MACIITVGDNSWITLAEANDYMECLPVSSVWDSLTDDQKNRSIVSAFRAIFNSGMFNIAKTATAQIVKDAQSELSNYWGEFYSEHKDRTALYSQGVRDFKVSKWEEELGKPQIPQFIVDMLDDYVTGVGGVVLEFSRELEDNG